MLWVSLSKLIQDRSWQFRSLPAEFQFFFIFKKSGFSVVYKWFKIPIVEGAEIHIYFGVFLDSPLVHI